MELLPEYLNAEVLTAFALLALALIRLTVWGKANQQALDTVVETVETYRADSVKRGVANSEYELSDAAQDALDESVRKVDVKKVATGAAGKVVRFVVPRVIRKIPRLIKRIF